MNPEQRIRSLADTYRASSAGMNHRARACIYPTDRADLLARADEHQRFAGILDTLANAIAKDLEQIFARMPSNSSDPGIAGKA